MPTFMDGLWRILFTIPLPLALNATTAEQHKPSMERAAPTGKTTTVAAARAGCICASTIDSTVSKAADSATPSAHAACAKSPERGDKSCVQVAPSRPRQSEPPHEVLHQYIVTFFGVERIAAFHAQAPPAQSRPIAYPRALLPCTRSPPNALKRNPPPYRGKAQTRIVFAVDFDARFGRHVAQTSTPKRVRPARFLLYASIDTPPSRFVVRSQALIPIHPS